MKTRHLNRSPLILLFPLVLFLALSHPAQAMSEEEEIQLGRQVHAQVLRDYRVYRDEKLHEYVREVGSRLTAVSERPDLDYTFTVLDSAEVNAFAVPGGYIYVTRGMLTYLNSEAQLASVLGHEIGHITGRHAARSQGNAGLTNALSALFAIATRLPGAAELGSLAGTVLQRGYGRGLELEADESGARYLAAAGYDPKAMIEVFSTLKDQEAFELEQAEAEERDPRVYHGLFSTHPKADTRLQQAIADAGDADEAAAGTIVNQFTFLNFTDGMIYGQSLADPRRSSGEQRNPAMGIGMRVPLGWVVQMGGKQITAESVASDGVVQLTTYRVSSGGDPRDLLIRRVGRGTALAGEQAMTVNGNPAFTAIARQTASPFGRRDVRYGVVIIGATAYVLAGAVEGLDEPYKYDREFLRAFESIRPLTSRERRLAQPRVIRLARVEPGMTFAHFAALSRLPKYAEQELRLMNGMYPEGEPEPGSYIKILE
jgi:predicted Zn-dependent protease